MEAQELLQDIVFVTLYGCVMGLSIAAAMMGIFTLISIN